MTWIPVQDESPLWGQDVLVYSTHAKGYAVAQTKPDGKGGNLWVNSTSGQLFAPGSVTHWRTLPPPPTVEEVEGVSGYSAYSNN